MEFSEFDSNSEGLCYSGFCFVKNQDEMFGHMYGNILSLICFS